MKHRALVIIAAVCCAVAALISYKLLLTHFAGSSGSSWFDAGCAVEGSSGANCAAVLETPDSYFPPKYPDSYSEGWHVPVAYLGLLYYSVLFVWIVGIGAPAYGRRWFHLVPLTLVEIGIPASIYYTYVMFRESDAWCPWCLATHTLNVVVAVCLAFMWPRVAAQVADDGTSTTTAAPTESAGERSAGPPSWRAVGLTVSVMLPVAFAATAALRAVELKHDLGNADADASALQKTVNRLTATPDHLLAIWEAAPVCDIEVRSDDPLRTWSTDTQEPLEPLRVIVFSDLGCSSCARFARFLDRRVQPLLEGHLAVVFKHYPLDRTCNADLRARCDCPEALPHTCDIARSAEGVRIVGGDDAFWAAHDHIHRHIEEAHRGEITPARLADVLGLDAMALASATESEAAERRIAHDIRQAGRCDIRATPAVFVDGKLVDPVIMFDLRFWRKIALRYWESVGRPLPSALRERPSLRPLP